MLSKILAVALTAVVLTVGGYAYWQYADGEHCCSTTTPPDTGSTACPNMVSVSTPSCCQEPSRVSAEFGCCSEKETPYTPEVLTVAPREVE